MGWVDADGHVIECEHTWDYLEGAEKKFRPLLFPDGEGGQSWLISGYVRNHSSKGSDQGKRAQITGRKMATPRANAELEDVPARLRHMDELNVDVQVLYPTLFLHPYAQRVDQEVALAGSYNRWMADMCAQGQGRLRWMCVPPLGSMPDALDQLRFAKDNGACGVLVRALEGKRTVVDPYFYPLYEEAARLDMCVGIHQSQGNQRVSDLLDNPDGSRDPFSRQHIFVPAAFFKLVNSAVPTTFPTLRFGFVETGASWVPWVLYAMSRRAYSPTLGRTPANMMEEYRLYVTCQVGEDVPYIARFAGENTLMIGTDYGHQDSSTELEALRTLGETAEISPELHKKIVEDNPRRFYGLESVSA